MDGVPVPTMQSIDLPQVHVWFCSTMACKFITHLARLQPPSVSPNSLYCSLDVCTIMASKCISKLAWSWHASASPNTLDHGLLVYLETRTITASKFLRLWCSIASPNMLVHRLRVYLSVCYIDIFRRTWNCSEWPPTGSPGIPCVDG